MRYTSTRGGIDPIGFSDAVMMGLATDGGLVLPEDIPDVRDRLGHWSTLSYADLAVEVMRMFIGDDIHADELGMLVERSYRVFSHRDVAPIVSVGDVYVMELFHGPTLAFKDFALQFLGNLFELILKRRGGQLNILGATSGDTGSAAIAGVRGRDNIEIFILHPHGRVSPVQERQMTTVLDANVHNIAIEGSFDDGQRIIKALFNDLELKRRLSLGAVNSVNWARVLAQIVYYFYGAFRVCDRSGAERVRICVPTGNFGNIFAGFLARRMGAPIAELVLATNENNILSTFFLHGEYRRRDVCKTYSPSMDIQVASNFERYLYYHFAKDAERLRECMAEFAATGRITVPRNADGVIDPAIQAGSADNTETLATIKHCYETDGYLADPHTAVGISVARRNLCSSIPVLCLATAHSAKFEDAIEAALGRKAAHHADIEKLADLPTQVVVLPADETAIREFMERRLADGQGRV